MRLVERSAFTRTSSSTSISPAPVSSAAISRSRSFIAIHGQCAQLLQVAPSPAVGASRKRRPGAACCILWKMRRSVATMNSSFGSSRQAAISCEVEPTTSASSITSSGDSGCTSTAASGCAATSSPSARDLNSSCTTQCPGHSSMSAPVTRCR